MMFLLAGCKYSSGTGYLLHVYQSHHRSISFTDKSCSLSSLGFKKDIANAYGNLKPTKVIGRRLTTTGFQASRMWF